MYYEILISSIVENLYIFFLNKILHLFLSLSLSPPPPLSLIKIKISGKNEMILNHTVNICILNIGKLFNSISKSSVADKWK